MPCENAYSENLSSASREPSVYATKHGNTTRCPTLNFRLFRLAYCCDAMQITTDRMITSSNLRRYEDFIDIPNIGAVIE